MKASFHRNFKKSYRKLPPKIREQFKAKLRIFLSDPFHPLLNNHALHGEYAGIRSINITGDYRAWYGAPVVSPRGGNAEIEFIIIGTHSELYS